MYRDFIEKYKENRGITDIDKLSKIVLQHYNFAASTRKRALDAIGIFKAYGFDLKGLRILDVGCAYGGFSIETAKRGACSYGVEISSELYEYACLNTKDEEYIDGKCEFLLTDVTSTDFLEKIPHNYFDLIIVNDVFEHIYDTVQLLHNLSIAGNESCSVFFVIPNGTFLPYVAIEGHTGLCGLSIVPPLFWSALRKDAYGSIYYRQYEYYKALFAYYGFDNIIPTNYPGYAYAGKTKEAVLCEYEKTKNIIAEHEEGFPADYSKMLKKCLASFDSQLKYDMGDLSVPDIAWKYMTRNWVGFAERKHSDLNAPVITSERRVCEENSDDVTFELRREGDNLSIDVNCSFPIDDYEFAYHLMMIHQRESVERSHYLKETHYEWKLTAPGMYGAAIYVKHKTHEHKDFRILTQPLYYSGK